MSMARAIVLVLALLLAGCSGSQPAGEQDSTQGGTGPTALAQPSAEPKAVTGTEAYPAPDAGTPVSAGEAYPGPDETGAAPSVIQVADGVIADGEYAHSTTVGQVTVYWSNDDTYLYLAAEAQTAGWLGIGLDPEERMKGADYIIAAQRDGTLSVYDAYGQGLTGPTHPEDVTIGGTTDLVASGAVQQDGWVRLEVQKPLDSGDAQDRALQPGVSYSVLVATGMDMQFASSHNYRGLGQITLD